MRILHIANVYPTPFRRNNDVIQRIVHEMAHLGHEEIVLIPMKTAKLGFIGKAYTMKPKNELMEIAYWHFGLPYGLALGIRLKNARWLATKLLKRLSSQFDLIHAHTLVSDGTIGYHLAKQFGIPLIVSVRATDVFAQLRYIPMARKIAYEVASYASKLVCVSETVKRQLLRYLQLDPKKMLVVPNGVNDEVIEHTAKVKDINVKKSDDFNLLFVGSLIKRKNVERTLEAIKILSEEGLKVHLTIVGSGPLEKKLFRKTKTLQISDRVKFVGRKNHEDVLNMMRSGDYHALILCSTVETFGMVYLEALFQGLPIIFSKNRGIDGMITSKVGVACDPFNVEDIASAIKEMIDNYETFKVGVKSFLEHEADKFCLRNVVYKYLSTYKEVLGSKRS